MYLITPDTLLFQVFFYTFILFLQSHGRVAANKGQNQPTCARGIILWILQPSSNL